MQARLLSSEKVAALRVQRWPRHQAFSRPAVSVHARRRKEWEFTEQTERIEEVVEEANAASEGMFGDAFKAALSEALNRQGAQALLQGQEKLVDENHISEQEEVLKAAIMAAKSTLMKLNLMKTELEKAIETETKQVERLMFALQKARSDAAYYRSLNKLIDDGAGTD